MAPASNRDALLEGAIVCLQELGYADTRARDIAAASGANLASIGYHFGSTEQLLAEALAESFNRWLAEFAHLIYDGRPRAPAQRLALAASAFGESLQRNRGLALAFVEALARAPRSDPLREILAASYQHGRQAIITMFDTGSDQTGEAFASLLIATFDGLLIQWLLDPQRLPDGLVLARAIQQLGKLAS